MIGIIGIEKLVVPCIIGIESHERLSEQDIWIDLKVEVELTQCAKSGSIDDTLDYTSLARLCREFVRSKRFFLLESLVFALTDKIMDNAKVSSVWAKASKPSAIPEAYRAFVELKRSKNEKR